jgi:citrate synthase
VEFLLTHFENTPLNDPGKKNPKIKIQKLANEIAKFYAKYKQAQKEAGNMEYKRIPCINHPVFKGNTVNIDPREDFVRKELEQKGIYNMFLDFYHVLVKELFDEGVTENVFCVNIDAVLAVIALKLIWKDLQKGSMAKKQAQDLVFILFILGRSIGTAAEIADHRVRGEDMDCRIPQKELLFVL